MTELPAKRKRVRAKITARRVSSSLLLRWRCRAGSRRRRGRWPRSRRRRLAAEDAPQAAAGGTEAAVATPRAAAVAPEPAAAEARGTHGAEVARRERRAVAATDVPLAPVRARPGAGGGAVGRKAAGGVAGAANCGAGREMAAGSAGRPGCPVRGPPGASVTPGVGTGRVIAAGAPLPGGAVGVVVAAWVAKWQPAPPVDPVVPSSAEHLAARSPRASAPDARQRPALHRPAGAGSVAALSGRARPAVATRAPPEASPAHQKPAVPCWVQAPRPVRHPALAGPVWRPEWRVAAGR